MLALGVPAALTQFGAMLLGVVDTIMVGHVGVVELDASALGNLWLFGTMIFGMGLVFGMDPFVAQGHGARDRDRMALALQRGIVLSLLAWIPIGAAWLATGPVLRTFGQPPELAAAAHDYVVRQIPSLGPFLVFQALRQFLQGRGILAPALWVMAFGNIFNAVANWALVFGHLGFEPMGLAGAATATAATRVVLFLVLLGWMAKFRLHEGAWRPWSRASVDPRGLGQLLAVGIPIGLQYGLEVWAFQIATLLAGRLGEIPLAAHVVALNLASLSFMLPLGVSLGATTRIGNLVGAGRLQRAQRSAYIALAIGGAVMTFSAVIFVVARSWLPWMFTEDSTVVAMAATVLPIAGAFQLFDGVQAVGAGVLRGMGTPKPAAVFNIVGFYGLALPIAVGLGFGLELGLPGVWWGLAVGLAAVALSFVLWIRHRGPAHAAVTHR